MSVIHNQVVNQSLRTLLRPFRNMIPDRFNFAINGTVTIDLGQNKSLIFIGNPTSNLVRVLFWKGIQGFEYDAYKVFIELVKECNLFFDIGANIGYYSLVAKAFNPNIQVTAFEPLPAANKYLLKNIAANNLTNVKVELLALSNSKGKAKFYTYKNVKMGNITDQLVGDGSLNSAINKSASISEFEVNTDTLDNYVAARTDLMHKIDLIKIDTEATEHFVFQGAENVLHTHRPIIMCEIIKNQTEFELDKIFSSHGYIYYKILPSGINKIERFITEYPKDDYFLVPAEKQDSMKKYLAKS